MSLGAKHINLTLRAQASLLPRDSRETVTDGWRRALVLFTAAHAKAPKNVVPLLHRCRLFARLGHWYGQRCRTAALPTPSSHPTDRRPGPSVLLMPTK